MRRVWFKKEMRDAILEGRKTSTTRNHPLPLQPEKLLAVSGSRFKAVPFAVLEVHTRIPMTVQNVFEMFYKEEGFESVAEMYLYSKKNKLLQNGGTVYFHRFKIVEKVGA